MDSKTTNNLYISVMKEVVSEHPSYTSSQVVDRVIDKLYTGFLSKQERQIIRLAFCSKITQKDLDKFLSQWDIEAARAEKIVIVAYIMKMHPELKFNAYTGPRLKGILNYFRFQNLELISHFSKIVRKLNQAGIIPMIIKGGAMRYLRSDLPRVMGDIDILLQFKSELDTAKQIVQNMGYDFIDSNHSIDVHPKGNPEKGMLDIHQFFVFMPQFNQKFNSKLFKRARKDNIFSTKSYLPCAEDMVFVCLNNLTHNLKENTSIQGLSTAVFDLKYLIDSKKDFDWNIVLDDVFETHTEASFYMSIKFINKIIPGLFPKDLECCPKLKKALDAIINHDKFYALYVHDVKYACKKLKLKNAICHWGTFKQYLKVERQHFFTKRIIKHPWLVHLFFRFSKGRSHGN